MAIPPPGCCIQIVAAQYASRDYSALLKELLYNCEGLRAADGFRGHEFMAWMGQREVAMDGSIAALVLEQHRQAHGRVALFLSLVAAVLTLLLAAPAQAGAPVRIGILDFLGSDAAFSDWSPMVAYLEAALPKLRFGLG